ncbi:MAG: MFS transporter [Chloroflexota bacterium]
MTTAEPSATPAASAEATVAPGSMRVFLTIWIGQLISMLGSGLTGFALGVWIFDQTGQATPFALTVLFGSLPRLLLLPLAGSLADRCNRRWIMLLSDSGNALVTLVVLLVLNVGDLQVWHIYLLAIFGSIFSAFQEPAYSASVVMLVSKKDLGRANGLLQMGQALESIITPLLAGALFVIIGLRGIILIDFVTYFAALFTLLIVRIPQPKVEAAAKESKNTLLSDFTFGWNYLYNRPGLFGLLWYYAMVNFFLNLSSVLSGPLVLSNHPASVLGIVQTAAGIGMLGGSILLSAWGGPKGRRIPVVIGFIALAMLGPIVTGSGAHPAFITVGYFLLLFFVPLASGTSQAIFQSKIAPEAQGRVFAVRSMISRSIMPIAFLSAGPLADHVFEPLMRQGGLLAESFIGSLLGVGSGRGIGLLFILCGLLGIFASLLAYLNPRIRLVEDELPDAI